MSDIALLAGFAICLCIAILVIIKRDKRDKRDKEK